MRNSSNNLLVLIALAGCSLTSSLGGGTTTSSSSGPTAAAGGTGKLVMLDLTGKTADEALADLRAAGFTPSFEVNRILLECEDAPKQVGRISCQSPPAGELADRHAIINVHVEDGPHVFASSLVRAQLEKLRGMTIPDAKAYLKTLGHDGEVAIFEQPTFATSCKVKTVCSAEPEGGTGIHDRVTLVINPNSNVDISMPP